MTQAFINAKTIQQELDWFHQLLTLRTKITFEGSVPEEEMLKLLPPTVEGEDSSYAIFVRDCHKS